MYDLMVHGVWYRIQFLYDLTVVSFEYGIVGRIHTFPTLRKFPIDRSMMQNSRTPVSFYCLVPYNDYFCLRKFKMTSSYLR